MTTSFPPMAYWLGQEVRLYPRNSNATTWLGIRMGLLLFGGLLLGLAWYASPNGDLGPLAVLTAVWVLLGILAVVWWRHRYLVYAIVYEDGLLYNHQGKHSVIRWEDIAAVIEDQTISTLHGVPIGVIYTFTIKTISGSSIKLTNAIADVEHLGAQIQRATFPRLHAQALARYRQGERIVFGQLAISQAGLHWWRWTLPWEHLRDITLKDGKVRIRQQGKWLAWRSLPIKRITNAHVALPLLETMAAHAKAAVPR